MQDQEENPTERHYLAARDPIPHCPFLIPLAEAGTPESPVDFRFFGVSTKQFPLSILLLIVTG